MNRLALPFALVLALLSIARAQDKQAIPAGQVAAAGYFEALFTGNAKKATELSAAPFSLDRVKVLQTIDEVAEIHDKIARDKGSRKLPPYTIAPTDKAPKLEAKVFPKYEAYRVSIGDEHIDIYVTKDDKPKVIGFSD